MKIPALLSIASLMAISPLFAQSVAISNSQHSLQSVGVLKPTDASLVGTPYLNPKLPLEERVNDLFNRLTMLEKAKLLHGAGGFAGYGNIPRVGLPKIEMTDGPQGVRTNSPTTAMPSGIAMAATWNPDLIRKVGAVLGDDALATGHSILLGPGVNLMRTPLGGRTFEFFGEDPLLAGHIATGYIDGVQSEGVAACIKHWTANNQEIGRCGINEIIDERPLRELYTRAFQISIRDAKPWSIMPAYNKVNGEFCAQNGFLNNTLLRDEFHFDGALISDWGAWHDDALAVSGGCTIQMPHKDDPQYDAHLVALVESGKIKREAFDDAVRRDLRLLFRIGAFDPSRTVSSQAATPDDAKIAREAAAESIVLLKNDGHFLPLTANSAQKILVVGPNSDRRQTMSNPSQIAGFGGSGATYPPYEITPLAGLKDRLGDRVVTADWQKTPPEKLAQLAHNASAVIFVGGISHDQDHEGWVNPPDKKDLSLPGPQAKVINALVKANPHTVVVLIGGSPMSVEDFQANVPAILLAWYPGMEGGHALADILFGDVDPSGRMSVTFGKQLSDWTAHRLGADAYPGTQGFSHGEYTNDGIVRYKEGMRVGYRGFAADHIAPRYAFGYGLSYTTFAYSDLRAVANGDRITISLTAKNTGNRAGAAVPEIYANAPAAAQQLPEAERPVRGLAGFAKVFLQPGETKTISIEIPRADIARWSPLAKKWIVDSGEWTFDLADSAVATRDSVKVLLQ